MWSGLLELGVCCAVKVSGEAQHVLEAAMTILLHAVEADDDKVCAAPGDEHSQHCAGCICSLPREVHGGHCIQGTCSDCITAVGHREKSQARALSWPACQAYQHVR